MKNQDAKSGDYVEIHLSKNIYEGVLLETPETGVILLKLDSGYNIGFNKKDIVKIKILEKDKSAPLPKGITSKDGGLGVPQIVPPGTRTSDEAELGGKIQEPQKLTQSAGKPNIAMIITGGTIAARLNAKKGGVDWLDSPESLFKYYPGIFDKVNISKVEIPFMKASEDMGCREWQKIAKVTERLLNDSNIQGVIITHGTDFLHYTGAALSFFLKNLNKPVVLTYSQRSIDRASSDANLNLRCAALAAISDMAEVMLVGHASSDDDFCDAMPAAKVRKMHSSRRDAFKVINDKPYAKIYPDRIEKIGDYNVRNVKNRKAELDIKFEPSVALLKVYPGQSPDILNYYLDKKYKGIVLEMSGLGHAPGRRAHNSWIKKLKQVQDKGMIVCAAAQTVYGRLDPLVYSNGRELMETGIIYLEDMLAETALVKLGWVLGHSEWSKSKEKVREKMLTSFAGELNPRIEK